jgi:hypothetical protein
LSIGRSGRVGPTTFAGSYTLGGWESVAAGMRWGGPGAPPGFPPHTPRTVARAPGMLHLALRNGDGGLTDVLVTDAPGEWFARWAYERDAADAAGARWIADHADAFLLTLDSAALAGPERGEARAEVVALAQRLGSVCAGRPVAAVWTKADVDVPARIREAVEDALARFLPSAARYAVTVTPGHAGVADFADVLACAISARPFASPAGEREAWGDPKGDAALGVANSVLLDPFFAFRVRSAVDADARGVAFPITGSR